MLRMLSHCFSKINIIVDLGGNVNTNIKVKLRLSFYILGLSSLFYDIKWRNDEIVLLVVNDIPFIIVVAPHGALNPKDRGSTATAPGTLRHKVDKSHVPVTSSAPFHPLQKRNDVKLRLLLLLI